jgi:hypothetical protein
VKHFGLATALILVTTSVGANEPIWAKSGIRIEATCDGLQPVVSPSVKSPDGTVEVAVVCLTLNRDDVDIALNVKRGRRVWQIALPMVARDQWRPQELLWSPDGQQFIVNGSQNAYAGAAFVVVNLLDAGPQAKEITLPEQIDMVRRFPPCKATPHYDEICRRLERNPNFNMSAISWTGDSHVVVVMAEVPSNSEYGGIMGQVEGYEIDSTSGQILKQLSAAQLKARWQSEMAFKMTIPEPPTYER